MKAVFSAYNPDDNYEGVFLILEVTPEVIFRLFDVCQTCEQNNLTYAESVFHHKCEWVGLERHDDTYLIATPYGIWFRTTELGADGDLYSFSIDIEEFGMAVQNGSETVFFPSLPGEDTAELEAKFAAHVALQAASQNAA